MNHPQTYTQNQAAFQEVYVSPDALLLSSLQELINLHFREHKDAEFYCARLAYTVRGLNQITKLFYGKTVFRLIQDRLITEGQLLLRRSRLSSKLIAYELGLDPSYFCRFFKKMTGLSPQQYREAHRILV